MCIVVDTNTFSKVFSTANKEHHKFKPVLEWILHGKGSVVYGGKSYIKEIGLQKIKLLKYLNDVGKAVSLNSEKINIEEQKVSNLIPDSEDFDDPHIIAILRVSECKLICSDDKRLDPYIKDSRLFSSMKKRPRIYRNRRNKSLLSDKYIADCCSTGKMNKIKAEEVINSFDI